MRKVITEKLVITCDLCGMPVFKEQNYIELAGNSVDRGVPVGPAYKSGKYDCCLQCYTKIYSFMNSIKENTN
ncbi:MAG: hypothetical protein E3J23_03000 [Candidatus Stahlbacteria bacterium]|nr:MAG: hypothetical protein E3J23_03000 [Candidatus Stahlbacteria bacterium]